MALINQGGALLLQGGALAGGAACCCGKCSGPCPNGVADCATGCGCSSGQCVPCQGACDEENPCPEGCYCCNGQCIGGCPDFSGCRIRVYEDYGDFQIERINTLVSDLQINGCDIPILIQDIATESCGDVSGTATVGYDEACNCPVIVSTSNLGGRPDLYPDCQPLPLVVELLNCPNCCTGPCDGENPCPEGCACVNGKCVPGFAICGDDRPICPARPGWIMYSSYQQCDELALYGATDAEADEWCQNYFQGDETNQCFCKDIYRVGPDDVLADFGLTHRFMMCCYLLNQFP